MVSAPFWFPDQTRGGIPILTTAGEPILTVNGAALLNSQVVAGSVRRHRSQRRHPLSRHVLRRPGPHDGAVLMGRLISLNARKAMNASATDDGPVMLIKITHATLPAPVYLSSDPTRDVLDGPAEIRHTASGAGLRFRHHVRDHAGRREGHATEDHPGLRERRARHGRAVAGDLLAGPAST